MCEKLWKKCCVFIDQHTHACTIALGAHTHGYMHVPMDVAHTHKPACMRQCMWRLHMHECMHAPMSWTPPLNVN